MNWWILGISALVALVLWGMIRSDKKDKQIRGASRTSLLEKNPGGEQKTQIEDQVFFRELGGLVIQEPDFQALKKEISKKIIGMEGFLHALFVAILVPGGHVLIEGVPGLAKTRTVMTLATVLDLVFKRIQCTPDMLPADITGVEIFNTQKKKFDVVHGPVFGNMVLVDEINRTTPKVQSALLQAMEEQQVTIGETTFDLPDPFMVLATQNPLEQEGTYALPEAQVDRFLFKILVDYPSLADEQKMLSLLEGENTNLVQLLHGKDLLDLQGRVASVTVSDEVKSYIVRLVTATRTYASFSYGGSPRASLALMQAAKAVAWLGGRTYVMHQDVQRIALLVLRHRVVLSYDTQISGKGVDQVLVECLRGVRLM